MFAPVYGCLVKDSNTEKETKYPTIILSEKLCDSCGTENSLLYIEVEEGKKINLCSSCIQELFSIGKEIKKESLFLTENPRAKDRGDE